eukprot:930647-Prorocentrum_minimum.AAC.1
MPPAGGIFPPLRRDWQDEAPVVSRTRPVGALVRSPPLLRPKGTSGRRRRPRVLSSLFCLVARL